MIQIWALRSRLEKIRRGGTCGDVTIICETVHYLRSTVLHTLQAGI
jgi:hypothetical protein